MCQSVSQSVCHTKRVERSTDRNHAPIFTKLAADVELPGDSVTFCFRSKSERRMSAKPEVELIFTIAHLEK